jgi:HAD superfamily hydrolase (TIGR01484 family)
MAVDLILSDVDGCLTPENPVAVDRHHLGLIEARNLAQVASTGRALLTLCTGRPQPFAELLCRTIGNLTVPCIAENGVWMYHPGTNAYAMDPTITTDHLAAVRALEDYLRSEWCRHTEKGAAIQPGKTASASLYTHDHDWLVEVRAAVEAEVKRRGWPFRISMSWYYLNCDLVHISKGTGVRRVAAVLGLDRDRLAGIGDTMGDLAIADNVGLFACPGNADARIKPRAACVATAHEAAGVWEIIQRIAP